MEDLIPLIIVIAISIIGAVGRKKKRQEAENISHPTIQTDRDAEIFNWLEKLGISEDEVSSETSRKSFVESDFDQTNKVEPEVVKEYVPDVPTSKYANYGGFISPAERESIMAKEGISAIKSPKEFEETVKKDITEEGIDAERQRIAFNLRQAVVYSEILNRKYV